MYSFPARVAEKIWDDKYRFKEPDGTPIDLTVEDTWWRIAKTLASVEKPEEQAHFEAEFFGALEDFKFIPAGRIVAGAGTGRSVTLQNCYVLGTIPDSMTGIFDALKDAALTMQQGGGIGHDFSTIRPKRALVKGVGSDASGPLTFMDCWDSMCRTVMSAGSRRGAMMATMRCDHPDIEGFIEAKQDKTRLRMFNMSVLVTDAFMEAVENDKDWRLHFENRKGETTVERTVRARDLWDKIMKATYAYAEPGVIFIDRINAMNPLNYCENIAATNPCVPAGTPILTRRGWWPIEDTVGSEVEVWNGREWSHVTPKITGHNQRLVTVRLSDGRELTCTPAHRFVNRRGVKVRAQDLEVGDQLIKTDWPVVHGGIRYDRAYDQGFFSGDGGLKSNGSCAYIYLYGEKKHLEDEFAVPQSRGEYAISGGFEGTDTSETKVYLRYSVDDFLPKNFVPGAEWDVESRLRWLEGICDSDGCSNYSNNSVVVQISAKDRQFLYDIMLMLNTLGISANLSAMKDCWRLGISANNVARLQQLGFQPKRLDLSNNHPQREAARFTRVTEIVEHDEIADVVYCFTESKRHMGCFNGILTGQCGEQPLPPYGACLLGSINLSRLILDPFTDNARLDAAALKTLTRTAVRMLDNVIEVTNYPLPQQAEESRAKRRIGLGITGLADALLMCGITYGSDEAVVWVDKICQAIARHSYLASADLAQEKGAFPALDRAAYLQHPYIRQFDDEVRMAIADKGLRNSHLTSIAPTGTISLMAGNVSSGIEPVFAYHYTRKVLEKDGSKREEQVEDYAYAKFREWYQRQPEPHGYPAPRFDEIELPDYFVSAQTLSPDAHVKMQAAAQKWVDSSISKTINCPEDIGFDEFKEVYLLAYKLGCKGCTTYRPNDITGSVLSVDPAPEKKEEKTIEIAPGGPLAEPDVRSPLAERPEHLMGATYKLKWPGSEHAIYITINDDEHGNPFEVFINSKDTEHFSWTVALTRMISAVFRRGGDVRFVAEELKAVFDPRGGAWLGGKYIPSVLAAIGGIIERHMDDRRVTVHVGGVVRAEGQNTFTLGVNVLGHVPKGKQCPKCSSFNTKNEAGCFQCLDCAHSKCG